jgi:hypothetical protein
MESPHQRQLIYASLLRYAPETAALRERALDRLVLWSLAGSDHENPYRVGRIASQLVLGPHAPVIRTEVIQETLNRLIDSGKVRPSQLKGRHAYYLADDAVDDVRQLKQVAEDLFAPVLKRMLENTDHLISFENGSAVCRDFIFECFSQFGGQLARMSIGELEPAAFLKIADVQAVFAGVVKTRHLSVEAQESLSARCIHFLKSSATDDIKLKFHLTQGYCFAQLVGLQGGELNPVFAQTFSGSTFYLDTNVLLVGLLEPEGQFDQFSEMVKVAGRNSIRLKVTRATVNETRRVAADRRTQLNTLLEQLPTELVARANDQFFNAFLRAREANRKLTPDQFLAPFDCLSDTIITRWKIELEEAIEDEVLASRDLAHVEVTMQESALETRGWEKSAQILRHDVCHYFLVSTERVSNPKTWFLTRDRSLTHSASKLKKPEELGFCFSLIGFLQSISPFVSTPSEEHSLAEYFSTLLKEQLFSTEPLFDPKELMLLVEMQHDVLGTPKDRLIEALDYVKHTILQGRPYVQKECTKVALGLKTFLASSADERRKELEDQATRLQAEALKERVIAEAERQLKVESLTVIKQQANEIAELAEKNATLDENLQEFRTRADRERLALTFIGILCGVVLWHYAYRLSNFLSGKGAIARFGQPISQVLLGWVGIVLFCIPTWMFLRKKTWPIKLKVGSMSFSLVLALALSNVLDKKIWTASWSGILEASVLVAGLLFTALSPRKVFGS